MIDDLQISLSIEQRRFAVFATEVLFSSLFVFFVCLLDFLLVCLSLSPLRNFRSKMGGCVSRRGREPGGSWPQAKVI